MLICSTASAINPSCNVDLYRALSFSSMPSRNPTGDINKTYLSNTILSVESHNRRERENDCWRQQKLLKKVQHDDFSDSADEGRSVNTTGIRTFSEVTLNADNDERAIWAAKKARRMSGTDVCAPAASEEDADVGSTSDNRFGRKEEKSGGKNERNIKIDKKDKKNRKDGKDKKELKELKVKKEKADKKEKKRKKELKKELKKEIERKLTEGRSNER